MKKVITFLSCLLLIAMSARGETLPVKWGDRNNYYNDYINETSNIFRNLTFEFKRQFPAQDEFETDEEFNQRSISFNPPDTTIHFFVFSLCFSNKSIAVSNPALSVLLIASISCCFSKLIFF